MATVTQNDVTQSFVTMKRIGDERLCFEVDVIVGDEERMDGRSRVSLGQRRVFIFAFEKW